MKLPTEARIPIGAYPGRMKFLTSFIELYSDFFMKRQIPERRTQDLVAKIISAFFQQKRPKNKPKLTGIDPAKPNQLWQLATQSCFKSWLSWNFWHVADGLGTKPGLKGSLKFHNTNIIT